MLDKSIKILIYILIALFLFNAMTHGEFFTSIRSKLSGKANLSNQDESIEIRPKKPNKPLVKFKIPKVKRGAGFRHNLAAFLVLLGALYYIVALIWIFAEALSKGIRTRLIALYLPPILFGYALFYRKKLLFPLIILVISFSTIFAGIALSPSN